MAVAKFAPPDRPGRRGPHVRRYGSTRRTTTRYVDDIADGVIRAVDRCSGLHLYNLGHSEPVELRVMIDTLGQALGKVPKVRPRLPRAAGATSA